MFLILVLSQIKMILFFSGGGYDNTHYDDTTSFLPSSSNSNHPQLDSTASYFHCIGDNFLKNSWMYRSCQYRNICYDHSSNSNSTEDSGSSHGYWFLYPSTSTQLALQQEFMFDDDNNAKNDAYKFARISTMPSVEHGFTIPPLVSIAVGPKTTTVKTKIGRWSPQILQQELNSEFKKESKDMVILPIFISLDKDGYRENVATPSTLTILIDILIPIYNIVGMFGLRSRQLVVHIMNTDELPNDLINTLDYIFANWMGYKIWKPTTTGSETRTVSCFTYGIAGTGMLSVSGHASYNGGKHWKDYDFVDQLPYFRNNVGRGPLFWDFTRSIIKKKRVDKAITFTPASTTIQVVLATNFSNTFESQLSTKLDPNLFQFRKLPASSSNEGNKVELLSLAASSSVWIALTNDDRSSWPAIFMPRISTLIFLYDENSYVTMPKQQHIPNSEAKNIPIRRQYDFWNNLSHLKVYWISLQHFSIQDTKGHSSIVAWMAEQIMPQRQPLRLNSTEDERITSPFKYSFNSLPVKRIHGQPLPVTSVYCVGDVFQEAPKPDYQSCQYENLCLDLKSKKFVSVTNGAYLQDTTDHNPGNNATTVFKPRPDDTIPTDLKEAYVQIGQSVRLQTGEPWIPNSVSSASHGAYDSYYQIPPNRIWLPYYPEQPNAINPGHLLWDYLLPLYTLVDMFGHDDKQFLLTNVDPHCVPPSTGDPIEVRQQENPGACYKLATKFLSLLGVPPSTFANIHHSKLMSTNEKNNEIAEIDSSSSPTLVCAKLAVVGIGMLTDHGYQKHGQLINDYQSPYNHGRGISFWKFRNFMVSHMQRGNQMITPSLSPQKVASGTFTITFSILSSNNMNRRRHFQNQIQTLQTYFAGNTLRVRVQTVRLAELSLGDQMTIVEQSNVFISVIGGSTSTAMFLKRNACLVLYYDDSGDEVVKVPKNSNNDNKNMPAMLDWGFWNHASYLKVHWLPLSSIDNDKGIRILTRLLETEIESFQYWQ